MRKPVKRTLWILVGLFIVVQVIRPARTNPSVNQANTLEAHATVPPDVDATLHRSCGDCHSNLTHWPWYSNIAPVSWLVVNDVNSGRTMMNLSEWVRAGRKPERQFGAVCDMVQSDAMPKSYYVWIHRDAKLSQSDRDAICAWSDKADPVSGSK